MIEALGMTFGVEGDLQRALRANIEQLEPSLKIIDDGKERTVPSGRIDITAMDQSGTTVIIELKSGTANRDAIGQILSYLGDLSREPTRPRGILVAEDFSPAAVSAALAVPNIVLVRYAFNFSFGAIACR